MAATRNQATLRPRAGTDAKRAARVADQIVADVIALGWPVGDVLGSEADLLERYDVSRAVLREAVRLVEHQQVARTRRGPGGGLIVTEPTVDAVIDAAVLYLHRVDARLDEVFEARIVLEELAAQLAPGRLDDADRGVLQGFVDGDIAVISGNPRGLHLALAEMSRNPALELFVYVLSRVAMLYTRDWRSIPETVGVETRHAHSRIASAVLEGSDGRAPALMRKHLEAEADYLQRRRAVRQLLPEGAMLSNETTAKRAEVVARRITQVVAVEGMQPGDLIGSEADLIEREGVSRAVFREAVRLLEHHDIAHMRRGPGGGLYVAEPSPAGVTEIAAIYLARRGMQLADLAELRTGVEVAIVDLAATRIDDDGAETLHAALEHEEHSSGADSAEAVHDLHAAAAAVAGNRVLELVALVLIRLTRLYQVERLAPRAQRQIRDEVLRTHVGIAAAIEAGNVELARRRMRRHLDALGAVMRSG